MLFFGNYPRQRQPLYEPGSCFGSLLAFLVIAAIIIVCAVYFGFIVLIGFLILGAIVGGFCAILAYIRAIPESIKDVSYMCFVGNPFLVFLKKLGYFHICLIKYSWNNNIDYAKKAYAEAKPKRLLSFMKWFYIALAITVCVDGVAILCLMLAINIMLVVLLLSAVLEIIVAIILLLSIIVLCVSVFIALKLLITEIGTRFFPICFKFTGRCYPSDIIDVLKTYGGQIAQWISSCWKDSLMTSNSFLQSTQLASWYSPKRIISFTMWLVMPLGAAIAIGASAAISIVIFTVIYVIDILWILIKSIFKF